MNSTKTVSMLAILTLMVGCSTQHKATPKTNTLTSLSDVNKHISKTLFNYVDKDNDAKISQDEFIAYINEKSRLQELKQVQSMIASCDKNGDQQITLDEIPKRDVVPYVPTEKPCYLSKYEFLAKDSNHDNILTAEELLAKNIIPSPRVEEVSSEERAKRQEVYLKKHYEICDKNSDGKLTLIEASSQKCRIPSETFTQADSNQDNFLTLAEIKKNTEELENKTPPLAISPYPITHPIELPSSMPVEIRMIIKTSQCDSDKDRKLNQTEALSCGFTKKEFQENDLNHDGFFDQEDMKILQVVRQFQHIDQNHDGYLNMDEFQKRDRVFQPSY